MLVGFCGMLLIVVLCNIEQPFQIEVNCTTEVHVYQILKMKRRDTCLNRVGIDYR